MDILLNAAGVNSATPFFEISEDEWHRILDIDLKSASWPARYSGRPWSMPAKAAPLSNLVGFVRAAAVESVHVQHREGGRESDHAVPGARAGADNVRVNAILPGFFPPSRTGNS